MNKNFDICSFKKKSEDFPPKFSSNSNDNCFNLQKQEAYKILENIPKIHAFEVREKKNDNESPGKQKKKAYASYAKNKRNPYFVFFLIFSVKNLSFLGILHFGKYIMLI